MKKVIYFQVVLLALAACKKETNANLAGSGNIVLEESPTANTGSTARLQPFTSQDSITVLGLMNSNNLSENGSHFICINRTTRSIKTTLWVFIK